MADPIMCHECGFSIDAHDGHLADHDDHDCGGPCYCSQRPSDIASHAIDTARAAWVASLDPRHACDCCLCTPREDRA